MAIGGWKLFNEIYAGIAASDYSNLTIAKNQTTLNGSIAQYRFLTAGQNLNVTIVLS